MQRRCRVSTPAEHGVARVGTVDEIAAAAAFLASLFPRLAHRYRRRLDARALKYFVYFPVRIAAAVFARRIQAAWRYVRSF